MCHEKTLAIWYFGSIELRVAYEKQCSLMHFYRNCRYIIKCCAILLRFNSLVRFGLPLTRLSLIISIQGTLSFINIFVYISNYMLIEKTFILNYSLCISLTYFVFGKGI